LNCSHWSFDAADISTNLGATNLGAMRATATAIILRTDGTLRSGEGGRMVRDIVLFSCLAAFVAGLVIAAATLLI
jgi:hypothetical protein